jgi:alkaline phosphatase D
MLRSIARFIVAFSTIALRLGSFIFLRWVPSHVLWPAVIFFWITFILSFIFLLWLDLEQADVVAVIETTDLIEVVTNGTDKAVIEAEIDIVSVKPQKPSRPTSWMETIYLGTPNHNPLVSFATSGINAILLLMTLDLTFRTMVFYPMNDLTFHRPIPTSPYSANIQVRSPPDTPSPLQLFYKASNESQWQFGPIVKDTDPSKDYLAIVTIDGLSPLTEYKYAVIPPGVHVERTTNTSLFGRFETFPPPMARGRWSFGSSSCIKPNVPYSPFNHPLRVQGLETLEKDIANLKFFTFLGISYILLSDGR